jgi:DNA-binding NtrC family response regulator
MVNYYLNQYSARFNKKDLTITPQAMDLLMVGDWEGNVRELCNEVQRVVARAEDGETITPEQLSPELRRKSSQMSVPNSENVTAFRSFGNAFNIETGTRTLDDAVSELEKRMINHSLERHSGNISRVARELGLTRRGLYLKLERYGIQKVS